MRYARVCMAHGTGAACLQAIRPAHRGHLSVTAGPHLGGGYILDVTIVQYA